MSLILEALRKSEAERRRAQAPDLFAEPSPTKTRPAATSPRWLAWALAAVVALLLTGWLARGLLDASPQPIAGETAPGRSDTNSLQQAAATAALNVGPASMPGDHAVAPEPTAVAVETTPSSASALPIAAAPARVSEPLSAAGEVRAANTGSTPESIERTVAISRPEPPPVAMGAPASAPSIEGTLRLADLSSDERRQLPTLKMSMHLWHAVSAQRFVILDGERMGEGDRIGDAVIEEITRDGVLLAWQGRRLDLPIQ